MTNFKLDLIKIQLEASFQTQDIKFGLGLPILKKTYFNSTSNPGSNRIQRQTSLSEYQN